MTPNVANKLWPIIYVIPLTAMYYFKKEYIDLGFNVMYKGVLCMVIIAFAFVAFLVHPDLERLKSLSKGSALLALPNIFILFWSMFSWSMAFTDLANISRGISSQVYQILMVVGMAGMLYVFGKSAIWYNLAAMLMANLIVIVGIISKSGLSVYLLELKALVLTFAGETGELMRQAEVHELTFAIGIYLVYFLVLPRQLKGHWLLGILTLFCFLSGFKRIGIAALLVGVVLGWVLMAFRKNAKLLSQILTLLGLGILLVSFSYIIFIRNGGFEMLAQQYGIETMGRIDLYEAIRPYYSINVLFMGQGAGFVSRVFSSEIVAAAKNIGALHNDILQIFVDIGFIGFVVWVLLQTVARTALIAKTSTSRVLCFCLTAYCFVTYATDNTYYYPYVNAALAIIILGSTSFEETTKEELKALP